MKTFEGDFNKLKSKLIESENFAFSRFSDGEMYILQNVPLKLDQDLIQIGNTSWKGHYKLQDFKHFDPTIHSNFQQHLTKSFQHRQHNYYKGISCSCCVGKPNFDWQINLHGGDDESLTWANLWVNGNYSRFIEEIYPILLFEKKCVFIGHHDAQIDHLYSFHKPDDPNPKPFFQKDFRVGYNAMINDVHVIDEMKEWIEKNNIQNHVFLFSASSFSALAIYELYKDFSNNTYINIGTTLNPIFYMPMERAYLQAYWSGLKHPDLEKICIWN